jgi:DNA primase
MKALYLQKTPYWNSKGEKGNAIDFLMSFYDMDFKRAYNIIKGEASQKSALVRGIMGSMRFWHIIALR